MLTLKIMIQVQLRHHQHIFIVIKFSTARLQYSDGHRSIFKQIISIDNYLMYVYRVVLKV